jgi:hypothetical protein
MILSFSQGVEQPSISLSQTANNFKPQTTQSNQHTNNPATANGSAIADSVKVPRRIITKSTENLHPGQTAELANEDRKQSKAKNSLKEY